MQQELVSVISSKTQQIRQLEQIVSVYYKTNASVSGKLIKQIKEQNEENTRLSQESKGLRQKLDLQEEVRQSVDAIKE
jgi:regulator of replication initiation timing